MNFESAMWCAAMRIWRVRVKEKERKRKGRKGKEEKRKKKRERYGCIERKKENDARSNRFAQQSQSRER